MTDPQSPSNPSEVTTDVSHTSSGSRIPLSDAATFFYRHIKNFDPEPASRLQRVHYANNLASLSLEIRDAAQ